jgi:hypothetical protein
MTTGVLEYMRDLQAKGLAFGAQGATRVLGDEGIKLIVCFEKKG